MTNWIDSIADLNVCISELADNRRCWRTALDNNRFDECTRFDNVRDLLFDRYRQLGGTAIQIGDLITSKGEVRE